MARRLARETALIIASVAFRAVAGAGFVVALARLLDLEGFAAFGVATGLAYALGHASFIHGFWAGRMIARGEDPARAFTTGLAAAAAIAALLAAPQYAAAALLSPGVPEGFILAAYPYTAAYALNIYLRETISVADPPAFARARVAADTVRVALVVPLALEAGYYGAVASVTLGLAAGQALMLRAAWRRGLVSPGLVDARLALRMARSARGPLAVLAQDALRGLQRPYLAVVGDARDVAHANVALSLQSIMVQASSLASRPLYAASAGGGAEREAEASSVSLQLYFAGAAAAVFASIPVLVAGLYNPAYAAAYKAVEAAAAYTLALTAATSLYYYAIGAVGDERLAREAAPLPVILAAGYAAAPLLAPWLSGDAAAALFAGLAAASLAAAAPYYRRAVALRGYSPLEPREALVVALGAAASVAVSRLLGLHGVGATGDLAVDAARALLYASLAALVYLGVVASLSRRARLLIARAARLALSRPAPRP